MFPHSSFQHCALTPSLSPLKTGTLHSLNFVRNWLSVTLLGSIFPPAPGTMTFLERPAKVPDLVSRMFFSMMWKRDWLVGEKQIGVINK